MLRRFAFWLLKTVAPHEYKLMQGAIREEIRLAVERVTPSETPIYNATARLKFRTSFPEWEIDRE